MKTLSELISGLDILEQIGDTSIKISSIHFDSRFVKKNSVFVAVRGTVTDGHNFIDGAIARGAIAIIYDKGSIEKISGITYVRVKESHIALAQLAQNFYNHPSKKLKLVGVTGTNGKTTSATMLFDLFEKLGHPSALLSTIENKIGKKTYPATHTTPDQIVLAEFLNKAVEAGCEYAFMECSSHAIDQRRVWGLDFTGALFTNLTHEHLDYHKTMENYAKAKKEFFDNLPKNAFAVANQDDLWSEYILSETRAKKYLFSLKDKNLKQSAEGLSMSFDGKVLKSKLIGAFNAYNILGVYMVAKLLGAQEDRVIEIISSAEPPAGRLEFIKSKKGVIGIIDFAHTPDALEKVLKTLREIVPTARIISVVGCTGEADVLKRPIMGKIACDLSDYVIFSSDNPKNEDPEKILKDITQSLPPQTGRFECEVDRAKAVEIAYQHAKPGDIILLAGKGHEDYQSVKGGRVHLSEKEILTKLFDRE